MRGALQGIRLVNRDTPRIALSSWLLRSPRASRRRPTHLPYPTRKQLVNWLSSSAAVVSERDAPGSRRRVAEAAAVDVDSYYTRNGTDAIYDKTALSHAPKSLGLNQADRSVVALISYGKWQSLSLDSDQLKFESDVNSAGRAKRLVDLPENHNDIELWACLLNFCHRRMGRDGVLMIWQGVYERRSLHEVTGPLAQTFWTTILNSAVSDEKTLETVWLYAEWLHETHGVQWPGLYRTAVTFCLLQRPAHDTLRWHFRLSPTFAPARQEFVDLVKGLVTVTDPDIQDKLRSLYSASAHRGLYDELIPHLYASGHATLARNWRKILIDFDDEPESPAARPFLRYLAAYYPLARMSDQEARVAGLDDKKLEPARADGSLRQFVNRVHGETFGIQEKSYNDTLGAKWFASSWVPLDFAIAVVSALGIDRIGPLSLQSIALRERDANGIVRRLDQLESMQINVGSSSYSQAIRYLSYTGDFETLQALLRSDLHPDVFEDLAMQAQLLESCIVTRNWDKYRLILTVRFAVSLNSIAVTSNQLLLRCLDDEGSKVALKIMDEIRAHKLQIFPSTSHQISSCISRNVPYHVLDTKLDIDFYIRLCRQIATTRFPPTVDAWRRLLFQLGRLGRWDDLEMLALEAVRVYAAQERSGRATITIHKSDIPGILKEESPYPYFQILPRDLALRHEDHPLRKIFDQKLMSSIIRWGFRKIVPGSRALASVPKDYHFARGVRLLAVLRDDGLYVPEQSVRKAVMLRLTELYGPIVQGLNQRTQATKAVNRLTLEEAKQLCDEAWGTRLLPPMSDIIKIIREKGNSKLEGEAADQTRLRLPGRFWAQSDPRRTSS